MSREQFFPPFLTFALLGKCAGSRKRLDLRAEKKDDSVYLLRLKNLFLPALQEGKHTRGKKKH